MSQNPMLRQMVDANPQVREVMANPEFMRQLLDPGNLQAMSQIQSALSTLQSNGLAGGPGQGLGGLGGLAGLGGMGGMFDPLGMGGAGGPRAAGTPAPPPESLYATQLQQLQDMGFGDQARNIQALQATHGNVNAAVERLLTMV
eukprot:9258772-Pyramimonas_sp.AAC.1